MSSLITHLIFYFNVMHLRNISGFCCQSASRSYANTSTCSSAYVCNGCPAWHKSK